PKGVQIEHQNVVSLVISTDYIGLEASDTVAAAANFSFDAVIFEIWGALLNGSKLVVLGTESILSPQDFAAQIDRQGITTLFLTTALFNLLAAEVPFALKTLKNLLFGGEVIDRRWVKEVFDSISPQRLIHVYGPTESTTFATWYSIESVSTDVTIPIGKPIANKQSYILDRYLQPVPIGVPGELHIGGDGLARGYLNRPDLTAAKFIPNPFSSDESARLYKTGDLARYLPDGNIEFLGRIDNQVKIRGFRIELGEIEAVLSTHPQVQQAVAIATEASPGHKRLVAYLVTSDESLSSSQVRVFLKQRLPEYMVPAAIVTLDSMPLTPNGKVDRNALPTPDREWDLTIDFVLPSTPTQEAIAQMWLEVLGLEKVGIHNNFFDLGGNSLLVTQLISRLRSAFDVELPIISLFEKQTIFELAESIDEIRSTVQMLRPDDIELLENREEIEL
ncbi:non-ribosomal peptide synthetase, partial [Chamaesiphon polymorphus]